MFATFLLGTFLVSSLVLLVLLVAPRPGQDVRTDRLPFMGIALVLLFAGLAFLGGMAVAS